MFGWPVNSTEIYNMYEMLGHFEMNINVKCTATNICITVYILVLIVLIKYFLVKKI